MYVYKAVVTSRKVCLDQNQVSEMYNNYLSYTRSMTSWEGPDNQGE